MDAPDLKVYWKGIIGIDFDRFLLFCNNHKIDTIVLNYSGYGFQKKGIPVRLARLIKYIKEYTSIRVITFFHEIYASGPFYSLGFWTHLFQKQIFKTILKSSSKIICSNQRVQKLILQENSIAINDLHVMPIISNIGEPTTDHLQFKRENCIIVFGTCGLREKVYQSTMFSSFLKHNNIQYLVDVGEGDLKHLYPIDCEVRKMGFLHNKEVSDLLLKSKWAGISYPHSLLPKSGVFAAYISHQCCVVNFNISEQNLSEDGLELGSHLVSPADKFEDGDVLHIAKNAHAWYQQHSIKMHISLYQQLLAQ
jgi:hypothetical protein